MKNFIIIVLAGALFLLLLEKIGNSTSNSDSEGKISELEGCLGEYKTAYEESKNALDEAYSILEPYSWGGEYYELLNTIKDATLKVDDRELYSKISLDCST